MPRRQIIWSLFPKFWNISKHLAEKGKITKCDVYAFYKVRNCKIVLKTAAAKKGKKVLAKALKKGKNKTVKIK